MSRYDRMRRVAHGRPHTLILLGLLLALVVLPGIARAHAVRPYAAGWHAAVVHTQIGAGDEGWSTLALHGSGDFARGNLLNAKVEGEALRLSGNQSFESRDDLPFRLLGILESPAMPAASPFDAVRVSFEGEAPTNTAIAVEVRAQLADGRWSPWQEAERSGEQYAFPGGGVTLQYRVSLQSEQPGLSPFFRQMRLEVREANLSFASTNLEAPANRPTVRLYGTREGLVGRVTANGHKIVERDHFVALPSRKALNLRDGKDYQVQISYKGKTTTAPVWDVGPWNTKDNFWDPSREMFGDLPRFTPQVNAAFFNNYNSGNDQYGRPILYPASIDIADGSFIDDLGMKSSDWVDVTFLWLDATAPALVPMPVVVPRPGPIPQPIFAQQPQPGPTAVPTPTPMPKSWYFAEGSTNKPFDTWLLLQNPDPVAANAKVTYMLPNGGQQIGNYALKPTSRMSILLNSVVPNTEVSTMIESDRYILAERAMYFQQDGHDTVGAVAPSKTWYFGEGSTVAPFETWILMQNPNTVPTTATLTFFKEDGSTVTHKMLIPHVSRASLLVNLVVQGSPVGTKIESDQPIVAERAIYKDKGKAGTDTVGGNSLSKTWYLAEGVSRGGFDTWLLMLNPNDVPAYAIVTYMREDATTVSRQYLVQPRSRVSIYVNKEVPESRMATAVQSDVPIVAERSIYFPDGQGAHGTMAAPALSKLWYLPEGSTAAPFTEKILVGNPNDSEANVTATFMKEDGAAISKSYTMKPTSRLTLEMNQILPNTAFSTKVEADKPVVAERSMYFNDWRGGTNSMGIPR